MSENSLALKNVRENEKERDFLTRMEIFGKIHSDERVKWIYFFKINTDFMASYKQMSINGKFC